MLPFHTLLVRANNHTRRVPVLDPVHDAQHDAVVRLVDSVGTPTDDGTLTQLPRSWPTVTVAHTGYHEQPPERVHLVSVSHSFDCTETKT